MPKFSVIVPVYNVEEYLDECVMSVVNQSFTDWELILVDDGSKDNSPEICDKYSDKYSNIKTIHKENGGLSDARNFGLNNASGEYVLFLDSDDYWNQSNALELLNQKIEKNNSDIVIFGCTDFNNVTGETKISRTGYDIDFIDSHAKNEVLHYLLSTKMLPGGSTIFAFKRDISEKHNLRFKYGIQDEDYDFVMSVFYYSKIISAINDPFYMYRHSREGSITGSSNIKMIYGIEYTVEKWLSFAQNIEDETLRKDYLNYLAFIYSTGFVVCGRMDKSTRKEALEIMKKHKAVLKYAYWIKPIITKHAIRLVGTKLFSLMAAKYFDRTHI